jgi:hypothetical protein
MGRTLLSAAFDFARTRGFLHAGVRCLHEVIMAQVAPQVSEILAEALKLSTKERGVLIDRLAESLGTSRWLERLDEFAAEPIDRGQQPMLDGSVAPRRRSRRSRG